MFGTPPKPRVIFGTNGVCSWQGGFFFFVYYRGGEVLEVPVGRAGKLCPSGGAAPPRSEARRMRMPTSYDEVLGTYRPRRTYRSGHSGRRLGTGRLGLMTSNLIVERGLERLV